MSILMMSDQKPLPDPGENIQPTDWKEKFSGRVITKFADPCEAASKASMDCLDGNDYDRESCKDFFQAYRDCKKIWLEQRKADRRAGRTTL